MPRRTTADTDPSIKDRKTHIPLARIRKLVKLKQELDREVLRTMNEHGVSIGYIRGLLKDPLSAITPTRKKR